MYTVNALAIRQHFGQILNKLETSNSPVMIEKGRKAVAVLIPLELFRQRFVDFQELEIKQELFEQFKSSAIKAPKDSLVELREIRYA